MRRLSAGFAAIVIAITFTACSRADDERARQKAEQAKQELRQDVNQAKKDLRTGAAQAREDFHKADRALDAGAQKLKHNVNKSVDDHSADPHR